LTRAGLLMEVARIPTGAAHIDGTATNRQNGFVKRCVYIGL